MSGMSMGSLLLESDPTVAGSPVSLFTTREPEFHCKVHPMSRRGTLLLPARRSHNQLSPASSES